MSPEMKDECLRRLLRIAGQVKGIARMVDEDSHCIALLMQLKAAEGALRSLENRALGFAISTLVEELAAQPASADTREELNKLFAMIPSRRARERGPAMPPHDAPELLAATARAHDRP